MALQTTTPDMRQPGESLLAYRGRLRRERNAAVDALGLKDGDPVMFGGKMRRFDSKRMRKTDPAYQHIQRLTREETKRLEAEEQEKREREERIAAHVKQRDAFDARPEVRAAQSVRFAVENHLPDIIDRLTPAEWQALAAKLEVR